MSLMVVCEWASVLIGVANCAREQNNLHGEQYHISCIWDQGNKQMHTSIWSYDSVIN